MIKCNMTPPRLTVREIADDLLSFAKDLPRRSVHRKPTGRKAIEIPPSVHLHLFDFVEPTEASRTFQQDTGLTSFTQKVRPRGRKSKRIKNVVVNREIYIKEQSVEETQRNIALHVEQYLHDCIHDRELGLLDARLQAAATEIQEQITESEIDEKMRRLEARLSKAASGIDKCIEEEEKDEKRERELVEMEARLQEAAGEIALRDTISKYWSEGSSIAETSGVDE